MKFAAVIRSVQRGFDANPRLFGDNVVPYTSVLLDADPQATEELMALLGNQKVIHVTFKEPKKE